MFILGLCYSTKMNKNSLVVFPIILMLVACGVTPPEDYEPTYIAQTETAEWLTGLPTTIVPETTVPPKPSDTPIPSDIPAPSDTPIVPSDTPTSTEEWQPAVDFVEVYLESQNKAIQTVEWEQIWEMFHIDFRYKFFDNQIENFRDDWEISENAPRGLRVGYGIYACGPLEIDVYLLFYNRDDDLYLDKLGSDNLLKYTLDYGSGQWSIYDSRDIEERGTLCPLVISKHID